MKKLLCIIMCGLLLYNTMGFSLVYWVEEYASIRGRDNFIAKKITTENEFIVVKIPVMLPYQTDWQAQPAEGKLRRGNDFYQIIEQQLVNDTLRVTCKIDLDARERFFDLASHVEEHVKDKPADTQKKSSAFLKNFLKDYLPFGKNTPSFFLTENLFYTSPLPIFCSSILSQYIDILAPPPRFF